jgi:hypothetical protein
MPKWLDREIRASKVMLLVFTGSANRSKGLAKQLESARQSGLVVIPLRMGETPPHAHIDYQAGEAPWIDMLEDWGKGLGLLHSCLARVVPRETAPGPDAPNLVGPSSPLYQDGKCPSSCLSPLKNLTSLHSLSLTGTLIRDVSPLSQLSALRYLDLRGTLVNDISAVTHVHIVKVDHGKRRALGRGKRGGRQVVMWRNRPLATITAVNSPP